jgi:hypothetical protein
MNRRFRLSFVCPFCKPPFEHYRVSPLGVATGKYSQKKRLILDLSSPHSKDVASINDIIDKEQCSMSYRDIIKNLRAATASKRKPSVEIIERLISNKIMAIVSAKRQILKAF